MLYLFKQYCLQWYGTELWIGNNKSAYKQFEIGYHKAIKKILKVSTHESNHYVCQEASLYTFEHFINKQKILSSLRYINKPCIFIEKILSFLTVSSFFFRDVYSMLNTNYELDSLTDNDRDAIMSRISFVQNHETQLRTGWG